MLNPLGDFERAFFGDEKVHVVHLHGINAVLLHEEFERSRDTSRLLIHPSPRRHRDDGAKAAREGTSERRIVRDRTCAEIVLVDVAIHRHAVVRQVRILVEHARLANRVVHDPRAVLPRQALDAGERAAETQRVNQQQQWIFPLRSDDEVDDRRGENDIGMLRREVAAPHDDGARRLLANLPAHLDRLSDLRPRHDRHGDEGEFVRRQD